MKWCFVISIALGIIIIAIAIASNIYKSPSMDFKAGIIQIIAKTEDTIKSNDEILKQVKVTIDSSSKQLVNLKRMLSIPEVSGITTTEQQASSSMVLEKGLSLSASSLQQIITNLKMQSEKIDEQRRALKELKSNLEKIKN